jgi:hypothetical protein
MKISLLLQSNYLKGLLTFFRVEIKFLSSVSLTTGILNKNESDKYRYSVIQALQYLTAYSKAKKTTGTYKHIVKN